MVVVLEITLDAVKVLVSKSYLLTKYVKILDILIKRLFNLLNAVAPTDMKKTKCLGDEC